MLNIQRSKSILAIALPIMAGMSSQSLLNLIDAAMVGTLGSDALAAVGIGGYANFMTVAVVIGIGAGVQAMVARRKGEERTSEMAVPLNSGLLLVLLFSLPIFALAYYFATPLMHLLLKDPEVAVISHDYYLARLFGIFAIGLNFAFRGYWNGINKSTTYMQTLIAMHIFNVVISYGLIFGRFGLPEMGATGAGVGTTLSLYFGSALYFIQSWSGARQHGFLHALPPKTEIKMLLKLAVPNSLQQFLFSAGLVTLFTIIGMVGTNEL